MKPRAELRKTTPRVQKIVQAFLGVEGTIAAGGLPPSLLDLVRMRVSQINGCAYCLDMHSKELRAAGETEQRIYCLDAWRETPFYDDRERAALAWAEAVTNLHEGHVPDEVYEEVRRHFTEEEVEVLTAAVAAINVWNRLNISLRNVPGDYQPRARRAEGREATAAAR
ncbi:MAG TPA: carboxymuconolactone decarboxylase family protein [Gemmataceae bacterium]|jgi:AhpD family alkylhydroperoxidase